MSKPEDQNLPDHPRGYPIYRPHWDERPTELLNCCFEHESELDWIRIAKFGDRIIAAYRIAKTGEFGFEICSLVVHSDFRGRGLGQWLVQHAMGLIESKGGLVVIVQIGCQVSMLERLGFEWKAEFGYRHQLVQE